MGNLRKGIYEELCIGPGGINCPCCSDLRKGKKGANKNRLYNRILRRRRNRRAEKEMEQEIKGQED